MNRLSFTHVDAVRESGRAAEGA